MLKIFDFNVTLGPVNEVDRYMVIKNIILPQKIPSFFFFQESPQYFMIVVATKQFHTFINYMQVLIELEAIST